MTSFLILTFLTDKQRGLTLDINNYFHLEKQNLSVGRERDFEKNVSFPGNFSVPVISFDSREFFRNFS